MPAPCTADQVERIGWLDRLVTAPSARALWTADQLEHARFPLGELTKPEVRAVARSLGLVTADKPESQEICFVPGGDYRDALRTRAGCARTFR